MEVCDKSQIKNNLSYYKILKLNLDTTFYKYTGRDFDVLHIQKEEEQVSLVLYILHAC